MADLNPELKVEIAEAWNGYCAHLKCLNKTHSIHHRLPNTKYNHKKYPLFLQSPFNAIPLCIEHHTNNAHEYTITPKQADLYEQWLADNKFYKKQVMEELLRQKDEH